MIILHLFSIKYCFNLQGWYLYWNNKKYKDFVKLFPSYYKSLIRNNVSIEYQIKVLKSK